MTLIRGLITFEYDPDSGKVLGGQFVEEAKAEIKAAQELINAWEQEFPGQMHPFSIPLQCTEFTANVVSIKNPNDVRQCRLATTMWGKADTARLDAFVGSLVPKGKTTKQYITDFSTRLARAIKVMHKKLNGTYTSNRGSSISLGNITPSGCVYDYETVQLPSESMPVSFRQFQLRDIQLALHVIASVVYEIGDWNLVMVGFQIFYRHYTDASNVSSKFDETANYIATHDPSKISYESAISELVNLIDSGVIWRE